MCTVRSQCTPVPDTRSTDIMAVGNSATIRSIENASRPENHTISKTVNMVKPRSRNLRIKQTPPVTFRGWGTITYTKFNMADGRHLENRYDVITAAGDPIPMKFSMPTQNHAQMTAVRSISKPEVECKYGGFLFLETGSGNIAAVH